MVAIALINADINVIILSWKQFANRNNTHDTIAKKNPKIIYLYFFSFTATRDALCVTKLQKPGKYSTLNRSYLFFMDSGSFIIKTNAPCKTDLRRQNWWATLLFSAIASSPH